MILIFDMCLPYHPRSIVEIIESPLLIPLLIVIFKFYQLLPIELRTSIEWRSSEKIAKSG